MATAATQRRAHHGGAAPLLDLRSLGFGDEPVIGPEDESRPLVTLLSDGRPGDGPGLGGRRRCALRSSCQRRSAPSSCTGTSGWETSSPSGARITAVVDWEIWSVGDPRVDLGWFLLNGDPDTYRPADPLLPAARRRGAELAPLSMPARADGCARHGVVRGACLVQVGRDVVTHREAQPPAFLARGTALEADGARAVVVAFGSSGSGRSGTVTAVQRAHIRYRRRRGFLGRWATPGSSTRCARPRGKGRPDGALHGVHPQALFAPVPRGAGRRGSGSIPPRSTTSSPATGS